MNVRFADCRYDLAEPTLARLQTHAAPIRTLAKIHDLSVRDSLIRKLGAKKIETLADLRSAGTLRRSNVTVHSLSPWGRGVGEDPGTRGQLIGDRK